MLSMLQAIDVLLKDGYICACQNATRSFVKYKVMAKHPLIFGVCYSVGYISERTLRTLVEFDFVTLVPGSRRDDDGRYIWRYDSNIRHLNGGEEDA